MKKIKYLLRSFINYFDSKSCSYCGSNEFVIVIKKYFFTSLVECKKCYLRYRIPKDKLSYLKEFYQTEYKVANQLMTTFPSTEELAMLKKTNFKGFRDYYMEIIQQLTKNKPLKILDYGCSWGYFVYKMKSIGLDAVGFELSKIRSKYGEDNLDIKIYTEDAEIRNENDIFFSSHVIEHIYDLKEHFNLIKEKLTAQGLLVAFCPNGSEEFNKRNPILYNQTWGNLHPNYISIPFLQSVFAESPYAIFTGDDNFDLEKISKWDGVSQYVDGYKEGYELLIISKPNLSC